MGYYWLMHRRITLSALAASSAGLVVLLAQVPAAIVADADYLRRLRSYTTCGRRRRT
jgi:hypothetical protein